jgi:oxidase EvaA
MKYALNWIRKQKKINKIQIKKVNLLNLKKWNINKIDIHHFSKKFFQIIGISVRSNFGKKNWDQPIMVQNENGILGIIVKKFNREYKYLLQAKVEPGNINLLQISPTVQATESNYSRVHGGKDTNFINFFKKKKFLMKSKQSEQGLRYLHKFNTNYLILINKKINLPYNFRWFSKTELKKLIKIKNIINMDTISIFSCFLNKNSKEQKINSRIKLSLWFKNNSKKFFIIVKKKAIYKIKDWVFSKKEIYNIRNRHFSIIGLQIKSNCREVPEWDQPIIAGKKLGFAGFIVTKYKNTLHYLCRYIVKPGLKSGNISCSANCSDIKDFKYNSNIPFYEFEILDYFFKKKNILYDNIHSDEGGRFYQTQVKRVVIKINNYNDIKINDNFFWLSHNQFIDMIDKGLVDIEARLLFACFNFDKIKL